MTMWRRRLAPLAAAVGLFVAACDTGTPDEPAPPPDEGSSSGEPAEDEPGDDEPAEDEPAEDGRPEDDRTDDGDRSPGDPSAPPTVELSAWADEAPANLNHRIEGTVTDASGDGEFGVPVRFEVYRGDTVVLAVDRQTEADGEVLFSYNGGARPRDTDVVVACAIDPEAEASGEATISTDEKDAGASSCTEGAVESGDEPTGGPAVDPEGASATVRWVEERRADPDPAGSDFFGEAITIDPDEQLLEVQLLPRDADIGSFVVFEYTDDADYELGGQSVSMETFACGVQRTVDDDTSEQRLTISLTPPEVMRYLLTTSTDLDECL